MTKHQSACADADFVVRERRCDEWVVSLQMVGLGCGASASGEVEIERWLEARALPCVEPLSVQ